MPGPTAQTPPPRRRWGGGPPGGRSEGASRGPQVGWRRRPRGRAMRWARPFLVSTALLVVLVVLHGGLPRRGDPARLRVGRRSISPTPGGVNDIDCRLVHGADDPCAFVLANCGDEAAGLLPYLEFYYCSAAGGSGGSGLRAAAAFGVLVAWLGLLFTTIGIAASDFFSVNLGTIARILGLSESLAGVTFLAFGNGSPDVFSTFAAMGSNSGSMAIGELIGAAGFITAVVAGSMALVREFRVSRRTFVRDILFFIASVAFAMVFLADGRLAFWECCVMIAFYVFYVLTVVGWHWVSTRRRRRRLREAAARATAADDDANFAPYHDYVRTPEGDDDGDDDRAGGRDDPDDTAPVGGRRRRRSPDISALERGPRIAVQSVESPPMPWRDDTTATASSPAFQPLRLHHHHHNHNHRVLQAEDAEDAEERRNRHITAEMKSNMRVSMPGGRRGTTTSMTTPIRPSLLGALEFRSVLASLQRSGTMRLGPLDGRGRRRPSQQLQPEWWADQNGGGRPAMARGHSMSVVDAPGATGAAGRGQPPAAASTPALPSGPPSLAAPVVAGRDRAFSSGDVPPVRTAAARVPGREGGRSQPLLLGIDSPFAATTTTTTTADTPNGGLHLDIPGAVGASSVGSSSPALSPFPGYTESPLPFTPVMGPDAGPGGLEPPSRVSSFGLATQTEEDEEGREEVVDDGGDVPRSMSVSAADTASYPGLETHEGGHGGAHAPRPVRWWPYRVLPPPHVLMRTFFPSLAGWHEKTAWDRFVSLISVPTVFLLVLTLPVVELQDEEDEEDAEDADVDGLLHHDGVDDEIEAAYGEPTVADPAGTAPLNEWQRYRRSTNASTSIRGMGVGAGVLLPQAEDVSSSTAVSLRSASPLPASPGDVEAAAAGGRDAVPAIASTLDNPPAKPQGPAVAEVVTIDDMGAAQDENAFTTTVVPPAAAVAAGWNRWLVAVQLVAGPLFTVCVVWANMADELAGKAGWVLALLVVGSLATSAVLVGLLLATTTATTKTRAATAVALPGQVPHDDGKATAARWDGLLCFLGFVISVAWISTVAGEVVGVLKAIGVIAGISEAILGLTIFAVGNSLGDLVADMTVARLGYPVMALSACFGGPMLNILLGVGIGGAWVTTQAARDREHRNPGEPRQYEPYRIAVGSSLLVSAVTVLATLVVLLVAVPANGWVMSRKIGLALIGLWTVSTVGNVVMEVIGEW